MGAVRACAWTAVIVVTVGLAQYGYIAYFLAQTGGVNPRGHYFEALRHSGELVFLSVAIAMTAGLLLVFLVARAAAPEDRPWRLAMPGPWAVVRWLAATLALSVASGFIDGLIRGSPQQDPVRDMLASALHPSTIWIAAVVVGPVFEEILLRGFMLPPLAKGRLGRWPAIAIVAAAWVLIHFQYGLWESAPLFVFGLLLGHVRLATGSVGLPIAMHATWNLIGMVERSFLAS